jgi:hypothetical protein
MPNGNTTLIQEIKRVVDEGKTLDVDMRDRLLLGAVIDIYEKHEELSTRLAPVIMFYQVGLYFASAIGIAALGMIGALLTGQVEMTFK